MSTATMLATFALTTAVSAAATAGTESQTFPFSSSASPYLAAVPVAGFDDFNGLRTLTGVTLEVTASFAADLTIENNSPLSCPDAAGAMLGTATLVGPELVVAEVQDVALSALVLAPSDGVPGSGPDFHDFGTLAGADAAASPADPADFTGDGPLEMYIHAEGEVLTSGVSPATIAVTNYGVEGVVKVTYVFEGPSVDPDLDGSGSVDFGDLTLVLAAWGGDAGTGADLNGDDVVDLNDLVIILSNWSA